MKVSIVTINYNNANGLAKTLKSVLEQTYNDIDYIVIDGASTDGSKAILQEYGDRLSYWISEPDEGIYDAMNKGIDRATGDYLLFLNSGDTLYNNRVLNHFVSLETQEDIVYGNANFTNNDGSSYLKIMPSSLEGSMIFDRTLNHQSIFHHRRIFENGKRYDLQYKMVADWVLYNEVIHLDKGSYRHLNYTIVNYDTAGFSSDPKNKMIMQADRDRFYASHSDYFMPLLLDKYNALKKEYGSITSRKSVKMVLRLAKLLKPFKK